MAYDDNMKGVLFRAKERASDKHPEYTGNLVIGGVKYRLAAWVNTSKDGQKYFSIKASEPRDEDQRRDQPVMDRGQQGRGGAGYGSAGLDDEIPFAPVRW